MSFIITLENKVKNYLQTYKKVEIHNRSSEHYGHKDATLNSHLHIIIISDYFTNLSSINRQKAIYKIFDNEFRTNQIHALTFDLKTECEYLGDA